MDICEILDRYVCYKRIIDKVTTVYVFTTSRYTQYISNYLLNSVRWLGGTSMLKKTSASALAGLKSSGTGHTSCRSLLG